MGAYVQISDRYTTNNKITHYKGYATKMLDLIEDRVSHFVVLILFTGFSTNKNVFIWFNVWFYSFQSTISKLSISISMYEKPII